MKNLLLAAVLVSTIAIAQEPIATNEKVFLRCPIDGVPTAHGYDLMLDKKALKLYLIVPGLDPAIFNLTETDTEYRSITEVDGRVLSKLVINKFTLKLMSFDSWAAAFNAPTTNTAQCSVVEKKL